MESYETYWKNVLSPVFQVGRCKERTRRPPRPTPPHPVSE